MQHQTNLGMEEGRKVVNRRRTSFLIQIAFSAALGGFLFGYDTAVINGAVSAIGEVFNASSGVLGFAIASALLGSAGGALTAGFFSDRFGRRLSMLIASVMFLASAIGSGFAFSLTDLIVWRMLGGVAVGFASVLAPSYISEVSPARMRGRLGSLQQLAIVTGIFIALLFDYLVVLLAPGQTAMGVVLGLPAWRWMFLSEVAPAVIYGLMVLGIPRSPRFLVTKGLLREARWVIEQLYEEPAERVIKRIQDSLNGQNKSKFSDILDRRTVFLPIVWVGIMLALFQQFVGINVIFYYSSILWESVGFSTTNSLIVTVITSITNVVTTFVAIGLIDKWGRKPLLLSGSVLMTLTLGAMSWIFSSAEIVNGAPHISGISAIVALLSANLFVFAFGFSWGPVVWVMLGEMFNNRIRAVAIGTCAMTNWIANFAISTTFPGLLSSSGAGAAYGLYATAAAVSFFMVMFFVKETRNKELEEMV